MPVTVSGDKAVLGFNRNNLAKLFNLSDKKEREPADTEFFGTLDKFLQAVIRATRQVPPDKATWRTPDRDRQLKVFCYHILADPIHVLDAIASHKYGGSFKLTYAEDAQSFKDMEAIAGFGEQTRDRLTEASSSLAAAELDRPIEGYAGNTNGHELLHQVLSHTAHHLRQLYEILRTIGVQPVSPLGEEDFTGIPMPKELW